MKIASMSEQSALLIGNAGLGKFVMPHPCTTHIGLNPNLV